MWTFDGRKFKARLLHITRKDKRRCRMEEERMFYMTNDEIDKIFPVDDGWSDIDRGDAIGKRQGAKWMRDKLFGNVAKPDACPQLYEGWRDRSDKSYYNEKKILIFTPCYEDITMRWRIIDSQFMDLCTEASHWKKLDEPVFV